MRALVATVALAASVAAASPATATSATTKATVEQEGVSLEYPSEWVEIPMTRKEQRKVEGALFRKDPDLAEQAFAAGKALDKSARFHAIALGDVPHGFHNAVKVSKLAAPFPTDAGVATYVAGLERDGYTMSWFRDVIGRETVYRITAVSESTNPEGETLPILVGRLLVRHGRRTTAIDTRTVDDEPGRAVTDQILDSVRIL